MQRIDPARIAAFKITFETCLKEGFPPIGKAGGRGSIVIEVARRLGTDRFAPHSYLKSVRGTADEPDWSLFAEPDPGLFTIGATGQTLKGVSRLTGPNGELKGEWKKTTRTGRDDAEVPHIPDPKAVKGISTLYDADGKVTQQWVTEKPDEAKRAELWQEFAAGLMAELPRAEPVPAPAGIGGSPDLLAVYPVGDHHFGMLAWRHETGESYDLAIADRLLDRSMSELVNMLPPCRQSLIAILGDFMHYDSFAPVTPTSGNQLDADSRYPKMLRFAMRGVRRMIELAAGRHGSVRVIIEIGNHDIATSVFLAEALSQIYENDPRVDIDTSPRNVHYYEFGKVLIGTHHGDRIKMADLPLVMATDQAAAWGRTDYRYWLTGHVHHSQKQMAVSNQDFGRVSVESFRVLPPGDDWHRKQGYRAMRDMRGIVMHRQLGEVARFSVKPEMFEGVPA